jgi:hypothetical protein
MREPLLILSLVLTAALRAQDDRKIVERSVSHEDTNWFVVRDYTWQERTEERDVDSSGNIRARESKTHDVVMINGAPYKRLIARNDQPLSPKEEEREKRKLDEKVGKDHKDEGRAEKQKNRRARERELLKEIPKAYHFTLLGVDKVDGRGAWMIRAEPRADYQPPEGRARFLSRMRGTLWVEKETYHWCRARVEIIEPVSFGWFLARLNKGATAALDLKRVNEEIWLPERLHFKGSAKIALVKTLRADVEITYRDYRKFQSSSEVLPDVKVVSDR